MMVVNGGSHTIPAEVGFFEGYEDFFNRHEAFIRVVIIVFDQDSKGTPADSCARKTVLALKGLGIPAKVRELILAFQMSNVKRSAIMAPLTATAT